MYIDEVRSAAKTIDALGIFFSKWHQRQSFLSFYDSPYGVDNESTRDSLLVHTYWTASLVNNLFLSVVNLLYVSLWEHSTGLRCVYSLLVVSDTFNGSVNIITHSLFNCNCVMLRRTDSADDGSSVATACRSHIPSYNSSCSRQMPLDIVKSMKYLHVRCIGNTVKKCINITPTDWLDANNTNKRNRICADGSESCEETFTN